jgi:hypothetical protein
MSEATCANALGLDGLLAYGLPKAQNRTALGNR